VFFEPFDMGYQFLQVGHAREVEAEHFVRSQCGLAPGPQADEHTGDDGAIGLNCDAVGRTAQQVSTPENLFEKSEEDFDRPTIMIEQRDDFSGEEKVSGTVNSIKVPDTFSSSQRLLMLGLDK
jgi:hypothetical protein